MPTPRAPPIDEAEAEGLLGRAIHTLGILEERRKTAPVPLSAMNCGDADGLLSVLISLLQFIYPRIAPESVGDMAQEHIREVH